ncbi:MAG: hypothetical protein ACKO26_24765 [Planctomycetota bacterium]
MRQILAAWLGIALLAATAQEPDKNAKAKESPVLLMSRPLGVNPGHKGKITLNGLRINDITEVISDTPGIKAKQSGKPRSFNPPKDFPKQKTGDGEVDVELELPPGFTGASVALVAKGPKGVSPPLAINVDPSPAVAEKEPSTRSSRPSQSRFPRRSREPSTGIATPMCSVSRARPGKPSASMCLPPG